VAELAICKKAAILVPFPFATDDHQAINAAALVEAGAALMFREAELTGERLAQELRRLAVEPERLQRMERAAGGLGRPEAARELVDLCASWWPLRRGADRWCPDDPTCSGGEPLQDAARGAGALRGHRRHRDERHRRGADQPRLPGERLGPQGVETTRRLHRLGARLEIGHRAENLVSADVGGHLLGGAARQPRGARRAGAGRSRSFRGRRCSPS
jgi:hypothetical protein